MKNLKKWTSMHCRCHCLLSCLDRHAPHLSHMQSPPIHRHRWYYHCSLCRPSPWPPPPPASLLPPPPRPSSRLRPSPTPMHMIPAPSSSHPWQWFPTRKASSSSPPARSAPPQPHASSCTSDAAPSSCCAGPSFPGRHMPPPLPWWRPWP